MDQSNTPSQNQKHYTIRKTHRGRVSEKTGTLSELIEYYGYTLECGHSWNHRIPLKPRTAQSLLNALDDSVRELQRGSFDPDYYEIA